MIVRREFIALLGGAAAWPLAARAQRAIPRVGWIWSGRSAGNPSEVAGFQQGLHEQGYVEGKNIAIEYRFGENNTERLLDLATDLARLKLDVILAFGTPATRATSAQRRPVPLFSCPAIRSARALSPV
jgi:ABC-type uncharacterized transport system substrate-binding protein